MTTKNSPARNLHRLVSAVDFIKFLMQNLAKDPKMTLHNACYDAYNRSSLCRPAFLPRTSKLGRQQEHCDNAIWGWCIPALVAQKMPLELQILSRGGVWLRRTMANFHTFVVRTAVKAGMYTLPTREAFLKSIGEPSCEPSATPLLPPSTYLAS